MNKSMMLEQLPEEFLKKNALDKTYDIKDDYTSIENENDEEFMFRNNHEGLKQGRIEKLYMNWRRIKYVLVGLLSLLE